MSNGLTTITKVILFLQSLYFQFRSTQLAWNLEIIVSGSASLSINVTKDAYVAHP